MAETEKNDRVVAEAGQQNRAGKARAPYVPPQLERLGKWRALTLQQSVPVAP
jgi:hypothetical protein